jgi:hypothetical protein
MRIGELRLFPAIRAEPHDTIVAATGVSCRQQIQYGTGGMAGDRGHDLARRITFRSLASDSRPWICSQLCQRERPGKIVCLRR